jgi:hypothetical protein
MKHKIKLKNVFFFEGQQQSDTILCSRYNKQYFFWDPIRIATQKETKMFQKIW